MMRLRLARTTGVSADVSVIETPSSARLENLIRNAVCDHQGIFVVYIILALEKHMALKEFVTKTTNRQDVDMAKMLSLYEDLRNHLDTNLTRAWTSTEKRLQEYYTFRDPPCHLPRICVKIRRDDKVIDLFRDHPPSQTWEPFPVSENTGFDVVLRTGKSYTCQDIPQAAKDGTYRNNRLHRMPELARYRPPSRVKQWYRDSFLPDPCLDWDWVRCWDDGQSDARSCYKSTLVVPMTFRNANLGLDVMRILSVDKAFEKSTYGFLCFDHQKTYFFNSGKDYGNDTDIGYVFADILSLYLVTREVLTKCSRSYRQARDSLGKANMLPEE